MSSSIIPICRILGALQRDEEIGIVERHLGLVPSNEAEGAEEWIEAIRRRIAEQVDLERLVAIAEMAPQPERASQSRDAARGGWHRRYASALPATLHSVSITPTICARFVAGGAELVPFSPLADAEPPAVDALFLGGGFPEIHMRELESNRSMRQGIAAFIAEGGRVYAECGGLMYLAERHPLERASVVPWSARSRPRSRCVRSRSGGAMSGCAKRTPSPGRATRTPDRDFSP